MQRTLRGVQQRGKRYNAMGHEENRERTTTPNTNGRPAVMSSEKRKKQCSVVSCRVLSCRVVSASIPILRAALGPRLSLSPAPPWTPWAAQTPLSKKKGKGKKKREHPIIKLIGRTTDTNYLLWVKRYQKKKKKKTIKWSIAPRYQYYGCNVPWSFEIVLLACSVATSNRSDTRETRQHNGWATKRDYEKKWNTTRTYVQKAQCKPYVQYIQTVFRISSLFIRATPIVPVRRMYAIYTAQTYIFTMNITYARTYKYT